MDTDQFPSSETPVHRRISLRTKLLGGFGLVLAIMILLTVVSLDKLTAVGRGADVANNLVVPSVAAIDDATIQVEKFRQQQYRYMATTSDDRPATLKALNDAKAQFTATLAGYGKLVADDQDRRDWVAVRRAAARLAATGPTVVAAIDAGDEPRALQLMTSSRDQLVKPLRDRLTAWSDYNDKLGDTAYADAQDTISGARHLMIILLVIALLVGAATALLLSRQIRNAVNVVLDRLNTLRNHCATELSTGLERFADGDLTYEVTPITPEIEKWPNDEIGDVSQATNAIRGQMIASIDAYNRSRSGLGTLISDVSSAASTVSAGSQQMAMSSAEAGNAVNEIAHAVGEVAMGSQRQVSAVESARSATEQVTASMEASAEQARSAARAADEARSVAGEGGDAVRAATEAMTAVRSASAAATEAIRGLGAKSAEVGGIVDTISGIAEQTNLLALNAAIEAARAGEQGRGFAVVADEVRKLAEESQGAARSIAQLIGEIQADTDSAVAAVESGAARTDDGVATVDRAREAFNRIDASVDDVSGRVEEIAASVEQVAQAIRTVSEEISEVSAVAEQSSASSQQVSASTQETSATTQEISSSAQDLAHTASDLEALVGRFRVQAA